MKLKKLEIAGFKSFKDNTPLDFSAGISAVVGPNGCGKSNIVDAIRWVMGEQRFTVLRGKKMDDVIFNGSDDTSGVNMAEVTITLENNGNSLPGKYTDCSEVTVSRRIYRDGDSEYCINKAPCRLLDVREFFMDAGVGARTYSIVEQERVTKLVEAKPLERREFIEEAAGIIKYKSRRESAARKMEATRQNLTRLNDIIREVRTQLNATSRQAKKAERFKELRTSIREAKLTLSLQFYAELTRQRSEMEARRHDLEAAVIGAETRFKTVEASIEELRARIAEKDMTIGKVQERFYGIKNDINIKEQGIDFSKTSIANLKKQKERNAQEVEELKERSETLGKEIESLSLQSSGFADETDTLKKEIAEIQEVVDALHQQEQALNESLEKVKTNHVDRLTESARLRNLLSSLIKGIDDIAVKTRREEKEIEENLKRLASLRKALADLVKKSEKQAEEIERLNQRRGSLRKELDASEQRDRSLKEEIGTLREEIGTKSSRLTSLRELQESHEWCNEGTRCVLNATKERELPQGEIYGLVADHIRVPKKYEVAVEAALGEKLQYIIVKDQQDGIQAIDYLKQRSSGRSSFIPLQLRTKSPNLQPPDYLKDTVNLSDCVASTDDHYCNVVKHLLQDVLLIPDLTTAMSLWKQNGFTGTYVTPEGDIINPNGVITGGSELNGGSSHLKTKREIEELEGNLNELRGHFEKLKGEEVSLNAHKSTLTTELADVTSTIHQTELAVNSTRKDIERTEGEIRWIEQAANVSRFNRENLASEESEAQERIAEIKVTLAENESTLKQAQEEITTLQGQWSRAKDERSEKERALVEKKILLTSREEKRNSSIATIARLRDTIAGLAREIESCITDSTQCDGKIGELTKAITQNESDLATLYQSYEAAEKDLSLMRDEHGKDETILREQEQHAQKERKELDTATRNLNGLDVELREISVKIDNLRHNTAETLDINLDERISGFTALSDQEAGELRRRLERNERNLEEFGEVNLLALGEHEQLKERYDFLTEQIKDLNKSLETLQKTINKMNHISRKRFAETFEAVNGHFQNVFPKLFPGGKGSLMLTDDSNMLETGVDIELQIPGKKRQNLSLLSGGEKALAAVALIFAILMHRPTPFLILDEADAPLDDANVSLFRALIRDIASDSQIIFITHNKRTMEVADNLIGVTMEKNGISSIVSVSLN